MVVKAASLQYVHVTHKQRKLLDSNVFEASKLILW